MAAGAAASAAASAVRALAAALGPPNDLEGAAEAVGEAGGAERGVEERSGARWQAERRKSLLAVVDLALRLLPLAVATVAPAAKDAHSGSAVREALQDDGR